MKKILVVDDQLSARRIVCDELAGEGYDVLQASDMRSMANLLEAGDVDLVVMDRYLDGSEGWNLLRSIKEGHPDLPVIIFSAYDAFLDDPRLRGADENGTKSMNLAPLKNVVAETLAGQNRNLTGFRWGTGEPTVFHKLPM